MSSVERCATPGILVIDKPTGPSSAAVVTKIKHRLRPVRIGHAGTLDPDATGILVVVLNRATTLADQFQGGTKRYVGSILLGIKTVTDDISGAVVTNSPVPDDVNVEALQRQFTGELLQTPPQVSAVFVGGERAYARARAGRHSELEPRRVVIHTLLLTHVERNRLLYEVTCSTGTYVRALARDIGEVLGCGATVESIRRERSDPFTIADAISIEEVSWERVIPWYAPLHDVPRVALSAAQYARLQVGHKPDLPLGNHELLLTWESVPVALMGPEGGTWSWRVNTAVPLG